MKRKKILKSLLALSLLVFGAVAGVGLTSCETSNTDNNGGGGTTPEEPTVYTVAFGEMNGVEATLSATSASANDRVTITINSVPSGERVTGFESNVESVEFLQQNPTTYYFYMPESNLTIDIVTSSSEQLTYTLTVEYELEGAQIDFIQSQRGDEVKPHEDDPNKYELSPNISYYFLMEEMPDFEGSLAFTFNGEDITNQTSDGYHVFTMPARNSTLVISERAVETTYAITLVYDKEAINTEWDILYSGENSVHQDSVLPGTEVTVWPNINEGYKLTNITSDDVDITFDSEDGFGLFTMPESNITVTIETEAVEITSFKVVVDNQTNCLIPTQFDLYYKFDYSTTDSSVISANTIGTIYTTLRFNIGTELAIKPYLSGTWASRGQITSVTIYGEEVTANEYGYYEFTIRNSDAEIVIYSVLNS